MTSNFFFAKLVKVSIFDVENKKTNKIILFISKLKSSQFLRKLKLLFS